LLGLRAEVFFSFSEQLAHGSRFSGLIGIADILVDQEVSLPRGGLLWKHLRLRLDRGLVVNVLGGGSLLKLIVNIIHGHL
jgi:hypothetical protein